MSSLQCFLFTLLLVAVPFAASAEPELVLREGVRLTATTSTGVISVLAGAGVARTYKWEHCSLAANMLVRTTRWYGSLGLYDPAPSFGRPFSIYRACKGISRTVVQEGQIHFAVERDAEAWLRHYARTFPTVWSNDGLVVQWFTSPSREQLNVDVWQICVANQYPKRLEGAVDAKLQASRLSGTGSARHECARVNADVVLETQRVWEKHWGEAERWNSQIKDAADSSKEAPSK